MVESRTLPRMRTLDEAHAEIKALDPHTGLTKYRLRELMLSGKVRCIMVGKTRRLVDLDSIINYLSDPACGAEGVYSGKIRPISERVGGKGA